MEERKFYKLDAELTARKDLTPTDKLVYAVLQNWQILITEFNQKQPSIARLGGDTGLSHVTVIKSLKNLTRVGLITHHKNGQGKVNHYTVEPVKNLYQLRDFSSKESLVEPVKNLYSDQYRNFTTTSKEPLPEPVKNLYSINEKTGRSLKTEKREKNALSRLESHLGRKLNEYERNDLAHYEKQNGSDWCVEAVQMHPDVRWIGEAFKRCQPYDDPPAPVRTLVEHFGHVSRERRVKMIEEFRNHSQDRAQAVAHRTTEEWAENWGEYLQAILPWFGGIELGDLEAVS